METKRFSGRLLRKMRERQRMSREKLALKIGVGTHIIRAWEQDSFIPSAISMDMMFRVLQCEEADLFE